MEDDDPLDDFERSEITLNGATKVVHRGACHPYQRRTLADNTEYVLSAKELRAAARAGRVLAQDRST